MKVDNAPIATRSSATFKARSAGSAPKVTPILSLNAIRLSLQPRAISKSRSAIATCPRRDSNPQPSDFESDASASWATRTCSREDSNLQHPDSDSGTSASWVTRASITKIAQHFDFLTSIFFCAMLAFLIIRQFFAMTDRHSQFSDRSHVMRFKCPTEPMNLRNMLDPS